MMQNQRERDELLIRLDERTLNLWNVVSEKEDSINKKIDLIITHQIQQNGAILRNTLYRRIIIGTGGTALVIIIGWLLQLTLGG